MGRDIVTTATTMQPGKILNASGQPNMVPVVTSTTTRALRPSVPANEALESARASSKWATNKQWGEQKGAAISAAKAVERGQRDAVKEAVPEARALFDKYSQAIKARDVLQRSETRQAGRDVIGLPTHVIAAGEIARGRIPFVAGIANWLRNNQLRGGVTMDAAANALKNKDMATVMDLLSRIGTSGAANINRSLEDELLAREQ
jgi:hypothetical protein